ncbi:MAG: hypothetical protein VKJ05_07210 [Synechococcaceae cyanobacterium]|nr:hypothetical protein [Synechococcaceae cyanobacterium]
MLRSSGHPRSPRQLRLCLPLLALLLPWSPMSAPALARTVNGPASSGGLFWQKVETGGKVQYICRSTKEKGIQKNARCQGAKAKKP